MSIDSIGVVWLLEKMEQHLASAAAVCFALEAIAEDSKWLVLLVPKARELFGKEVYLCQPKTQAGSAGNLSVKIVEMRHSMQVSVDMFGSFLPDFAFSFGSVDHMDPNRVCLCHTCSKSRENVPRYWLDF